MDAGALTGLKTIYFGHIVAWFCFLFVVSKINPPQRDVSVLVLGVLVVAAVTTMVIGFVTRNKLVKLSAEALASDSPKARGFWKSANLIAFSCATSVAVYGVVLKMLGSSWRMAGIFFGLSFGLLLFWRPRQLAASGAEPA